MSKTIKNIPKLRFPEFRDAPEWEEKPLSKVGDIVTGNTPSTANTDNYGGNKLFVSPADISEKRYVIATKTTLSEQGFEETRHIKANSILFVCIGSTIGKVAQNKFECATNQQINSIIPFTEYSNDFVYSALENSSPKIALLAGNHAVPIINKTLFSSVKILVPDFQEQQKIAECLSSLDALILAQSSKVEALKAHKKALMQQLFPTEGETTPRLRFPEFQNDGAWEEKTLAQVSKIIMGQSPDSNAYNTLKDGKPLIQGNADIINRRTSPRIWTTESTKECQKGDIILTVRAPVGAVAKSLHDACIGRGVCAIQPNENSEFLYQFFLIQEDKWDKLSQGSTFTAINSNDIKNFKLNIPKLSEQQKIADCLSSIDELISSQSAKVEALKQHKKALMQQLFPSSKEM